MQRVSPKLIEDWALAYLGRYASSAENLRRVLLRRARRRLAEEGRVEAPLVAAIDALVVRYCAAGLLDDAAYAASQARRGLQRGRSPRRIAAGLAAKGVAAAETAAALRGLADSAAEPELAAACVFARRRGLGPFHRGAAGAGKDSALAAFARAGFSRAVGERVLACADAAAVAALLATPE